MPKRTMPLNPELAAEAKCIVALAFRNGPIEDIHAGKDCPTCSGKSEYSHITQTEMKKMMKMGNPVEGERDSGLKLNAIPL